MSARLCASSTAMAVLRTVSSPCHKLPERKPIRMSVIQEVTSYLASNRRRFETELFEFLRFPSISASPEQEESILACAGWLRDRFAELGLAAEILPTKGWPAVVAETERRKDRPTVLVYGHYDVQPVDPLDLWTSPPFEP